MGPKLGVHTHKEKFPSGLGQDFQSDFLSVSCNASKETTHIICFALHKANYENNTCKLPLSFPKEAVQSHGYHR